MPNERITGCLALGLHLSLSFTVSCRLLPTDVESKQLVWQKTVDPDRDQLETTEALMDALALGSGMRVADIGAGWGYHTFKFSSLVGPEGRVFATDTDAEAVKVMERHRNDQGADYVEILKARRRAHGLSHLEPASLDRVVMINSVLFSGGPEDSRDREYLASVWKLLRPDGFLIYVNGQMDLETLKALFLAAGFSRVAELPYPQNAEGYEEHYPESFAAGLPFSFMLKAYR